MDPYGFLTSMVPKRKPKEEPQANYVAGTRPRRDLHNAPRQNQQPHRNEGGRHIGANREHDHRPGGRNAQQVGGLNEPGAARQHRQRDAGRHDHKAGKHNEQQRGGARGQSEHRNGGHRAHSAVGRIEQFGGGHEGRRPGLQNEQRAVRGQNVYRGGGHHAHGSVGPIEQRGGGLQGHRPRLQSEERAGRGQTEHRGDGHHAHGAVGHIERRGGGHHGHRPGLRNEEKAGVHLGNGWGRGNQEGRETHRQQPERPRARETGKQQQERRLGYKTLEELLEKEPSEVAITLSTHPGLNNLLSSTEMRPDFVELLCKALCRACTARLERQSIQHLLGQVKSSEYIRMCLPHYIVAMAAEAVPEKRQSYPNNIHNIISLLQEIISIFPASSIRETSMLVALITNSMNSLRASGILVEEQIEQDLARVSDFIQHLQNRKREGTLRVDSPMVIRPDVPVEDFRTISLYPSSDEIHLGEKPLLRPNNLSHKFESTDLYLDTHFRLLREDFVRPLRNGIQDILQINGDRDIRRMKFDDIRVYFDTRIIAPICANSGIAYKVKFDVTPLKNIRWQNSKRLLYGSLVCLSSDNFETFLFAAVFNRDIKELEQGEVQLQFCEQSRELLARTRPADALIMVETTAYFEAYRHVLEGLKEMNPQDVPFQKYIVSCEKVIEAPRYLNAGVQYNLSCMTSKEKRVIPALQKEINVLNPLAWPSKEALGFDESQMEAVQLALTKELAIIQGPPGTGKTYVGLQIAKALLNNTDVWQTNGHFPILVVCYTNHALDQFLEGIHQFLATSIVRVGGRSSSEDLKQFNLKELRKKFLDQRNNPLHIRRAYAEVIQGMKVVEEKLNEGGQLLHCSTNGIIHEKFLTKCIDKVHWDSLHNVMDDDDEDFYIPIQRKKSMIVEWLGLGSSPFINKAHPDVQLNAAEEDEEETEVEELVNIQEEADIIQDERVLDDEDEEETARRRKRKEKMVDTEIASLLHAMSLDSKEPQETEGNWQMTSKQKKKRKNRMKSELKKTEAMTEAEADQIFDLWSLDLNARWKLYRYWIQLYQRDIRLKILGHEQFYQELADRLSELRQRQDLKILQQAKVIGITTTGAAKYRRVLQEVQPRIVIVEEAAEVLEAHTITTLSSSCQHLILIGDHQQLRPSANVYDLAKNFNLEVSLFERLIESELPFVRLNYQHRMRPEIARLLTPHIYAELENHPSVLEYENIKGVSSNLFFVKHNFFEQEITDGKSHQNKHEAEFVVELCKYFLHQEYNPSQITILTTYTGQLFCLRKLMPAKEFSGVKVHVVDKYQGEENDIVILSLVRSNVKQKVGFLKIANRICVALSRAKKGLFCIGNMDMLSSVPLWSHINGTLKQNSQVGNHLMLYCQNHPETRNLVSCAKDFQSVPEGGCNKSCEFRLDCGHVCTRVCHPYDQEHKKFQCIKDCQKVLCDDGHKCRRKCFQPCGECMVEVEKVISSCGHLQMVPCSIPETTFHCTMPCEKTLTCGHPCEKLCGDNCEVNCKTKVNAQLECGHTQQIKCWQKYELESGLSVRCRNPCAATLNCGHQCSGTCNSCFQGRFHMGCRHACKAILVCSHECQEPCTRECPPCSRHCQNRCIHSQCKKQCGQNCVPCMEPCSWSCEHYTCTNLCSEPCDRPPCDSPCKKQLRCGHPCIGLCGEPCPNKCRICHKDEVTEIFFGFEEDDNACFVQLEDCGHILESSGLDIYMKGESDPEGGSAIKLKECPKCKTPIRRNLRYGTVVNKTLGEIEKVKYKILGSVTERNETSIKLQTSLQQMVHMRRNFYEEYEELSNKLDNPEIQHRTLLDIENLMLFYERLAKLFCNISKVDETEKYDLKERILQIKKWLGQTRSFLSEQEISDLQTEVTRVTYLLQLLVKCKEAKVKITPDIQKDITSLRDLLEGKKLFTEENDRYVKDKLKELDKRLPTTGLAITDVERVMIVRAMGLLKGHWFKCPNGHIYCITECGGAMESSHCPECKEKIGGSNHTLLSTNRLASEMDGAQHAAWSDVANNMINFQNLLA